MAHPDVILAGASVRSLAESAIRDGLQPLCVDMFGDEDLRRLLVDQSGPTGKSSKSARLIGVKRFCDVPRLIQNVPDHVPLIAAGGLENDSRAMDAIRQQRPVTGADAAVIRDLNDPQTLFSVLQEAGCLTPRYQTVGERVDADVRWLQKSIHSAGGQGVRNFEPSTATKQTLPNNTYLQEWIAGIPMSATFCCQGASVRLIGCALLFSGLTGSHAPPFLFCGNAGPVAVADDLKQQFLKIGQCVVNRWPIRGLFGVDVIVRDRQVLVIEVNPRLTASHELHEFATPAAASHVTLQMTANAVPTGPSTQLLERSTIAASVGPLRTITPVARLVIYADRDFRISSDHQSALLKLCRRHDQPPPEVWLADIPRAKTLVPMGTPFCSVYLTLEGCQKAQAVKNRLVDLFSPEILRSLDQMSTQIHGILQLLR